MHGLPSRDFFDISPAIEGAAVTLQEIKDKDRRHEAIKISHVHYIELNTCTHSSQLH